ncbi:AMP-binding protein [Pseudonocardia xishanensis]|uniref:Fatty-acid--CoA ligase FadD5 n=1 Tax=Pseudonocardia xishanensis TaxID=630995 RepID=A0ABP8RTH5_9PSEU
MTPPEDPAIRRLAFGAQLTRAAQARPDDVVYTSPERTLTWAELDRRVHGLAAGLADLGVRHGDRVAVLMRNRLEVVETYLAALRLGAIAVPLNFRLTGPEIRFILDDCTPSVLVTEKALSGAVPAGPADPVTVVVDATKGADVDFEHLVAGAVVRPPVDVVENDAAFCMYTSGTTGHPKGAVLTHLNLVASAFAISLATGGRHADVRLLAVPMFHIAGVANLLGPLLDRGRLIVPPGDTFDPSATLDLLEREQVTSCFFVPTQWQAICAVPGARDRDLALRLPYWGASSAPPSVLEAMAETFPGAPSFAAFGQTETSATTCLLSGADALRKQGSVGRPVPTVEIRLVDEDMKDVPVGEVGEIVYRGPTVMSHYWGAPEATAEAFVGGWLHSGDLCRMDDEGFLYVVDRKKDMIISGGENIYCAEVEAAIDSHPGVAEVAVVGVEHPVWVQTPRAFVVPRDPSRPPSAEEIIEHCRTRLASYKKPTSVVIVEALPRNAGGKVQKFRLREHGGSADRPATPVSID